jgi:hypothetical protein
MTPRRIAVALALGLALFLRIRGADRPLWLDEIGTLWTIRGGSATEVAARAVAVQGQGPLYYELIRGWIAFVGESELALRLPSALLGTLAVALVGAAAARALGRGGGLATLLLAATHPALVEHARDARPYALAEAAAGLAFLGVARAASGGGARDRALAWGGAVLSVHAHFLFAPLLAAVGLALARTGARRTLVEGGLAALALLPAAPQVLDLWARRETLVWVETFDPRVLAAVIPREHRWSLVLALGGILSKRLASTGTRRSGTRPALSASVRFLLAAAAGSLGLVVALTALGTNVVASRYLALAELALLPLVVGTIAGAPRAVAAVALALAAVLSVQSISSGAGRPDWTGAARKVESLALGMDVPVLLSSGFVEANQIVAPGALSPRLRSFVEAPLEVRPGAPPPGRAYVLLPAAWRTAGLEESLDRTVAPALEGKRSFVLVARRDFAERFRVWVNERRPADRFACERVSDDAAEPVVDRFTR